MNTRLTLNIEDSIIHKAKAFARSRNKSLSKLVEQYLGSVTESTDVSSTVSDCISAISDNLEIDPELTYDDLKYEYLRQKHVGTKDSH